MNEVDVIEQSIFDKSPELLDILLFDHTTKRNIKWATDNYAQYGEGFTPECEITAPMIIGRYTTIIQPRISKPTDEQLKRTRDKAEVFTPSWLCNRQNNLVDEAWFNRRDVFNTATINDDKENSWQSTIDPITFPEGKSWQDYVLSTRLEIGCGEAPYLTSRYDTVSGKSIPVKDRIGLLDRKLRVINENTPSADMNEWFKYVKKAYENTYGYDYQGDNVLLARENLLYTFSDNKIYKFGVEPTLSELKQIAKRISWNIWQMDGIEYTTPYSDQMQYEQLTLLGEEDSTVIKKPSYSYIYDWQKRCRIQFRSILMGVK